jgi:hypothetical protein
MKKIALITSFCNNKEKINVLKNKLETLKNLNIDTILYTAIHLPEKIYKKADYTIISKENLVFDWPIKAYYQWTDIIIGNLNIKMSRTYPDYGYAVLNQIKKMANLALSMDYDHFFIIDYDTHITDEVKNILLDSKPNSFFPSKRETSVWPIGLHLISLNKTYLNRFKNLITPESYLTEKNGDAFSWTHKAIKFIPAVIENVEPIEDLVYNFNEFDFFNYSTTNEYKLFIHKTDFDNIKLLFYEFEGVKNIKIISDNFEKEFNLKTWEHIELPFNTCSLLKILCNDEEIDYTKNIISIGQNILTINNI